MRIFTPGGGAGKPDPRDETPTRELDTDTSIALEEQYYLRQLERVRRERARHPLTHDTLCVSASGQ